MEHQKNFYRFKKILRIKYIHSVRHFFKQILESNNETPKGNQLSEGDLIEIIINPILFDLLITYIIVFLF